MKKNIASGLLISACLMSSSGAWAKGVDDRVSELETKWSQYEAGKIEQNARVAEAIAAIDKLHSDIRALGGGGETQVIQMKQLRDDVDRHYRDLEMRMGAIESQLKLVQDQLGRAIASVSPKLAQEGKDFQKGLDHIKSVDYAQAITAFQSFLKQYPKSPTRSDALFWIAECRYSMKDYSQAIKDYQKFVEQFPKSDHAPLAELKQGDAFLNLQMKEEAKVFYKKLIQDFPKSDEAAQARGKLTSLEKSGTAPTAQPMLPVPAPEVQIPSASSPQKESHDY
ncbi:MAG: tol-pal system protein YbgF [Deltaproteobacteria bacterium]|nr:tol-pal system protein YbgF [Deltaproteobacteria bacterium]